jgi:hypothetical protein
MAVPSAPATARKTVVLLHGSLEAHKGFDIPRRLWLLKRLKRLNITHNFCARHAIRAAAGLAQ